MKTVARLLADGHIVGWVIGGSELGPRALGHRSILADPRSAAMKDTLNAKVKHREMFRPFAPSVIEERAGDYFVMRGPSPFMLLAPQVRPRRFSGFRPSYTSTGRQGFNGQRPRQSVLLRSPRGVREADGHRRAHQHVIQRQRRTHRRDAAGCVDLFSAHQDGLSLHRRRCWSTDRRFGTTGCWRGSSSTARRR